jgi:hypothetical protein
MHAYQMSIQIRPSASDCGCLTYALYLTKLITKTVKRDS